MNMRRIATLAAIFVVTIGHAMAQTPEVCRDLADASTGMAKVAAQLGVAMQTIAVQRDAFEPLPQNRAGFIDLMDKTDALIVALEAYTESARTWRNLMEACG
jgi:hypothetical protein